MEATPTNSIQVLKGKSWILNNCNGDASVNNYYGDTSVINYYGDTGVINSDTDNNADNDSNLRFSTKNAW